MFTSKTLPVAVAALLASGTLSAADIRPVSLSKSSAGSQTLIFAAPPRETPEEAARIYQPIADYMSKTIGKKIVFKYPRTWGVYRTEMINGRYDIVFDGPHFNGYRAEKLKHNILVKFPEAREFAVIVRKDEKLANTQELAGRTFCAPSPPNLAALVALAQFDNATRQPVLVPSKGWAAVYEGVISGKCMGGVLPVGNLNALDKSSAVKVVFKSPAVPEQAFSAGPRLTPTEQAKLVAALTAPEAAGPTEKLRAAAKSGDRLIAASNQEYAGLGELLKKEWGFYQ